MTSEEQALALKQVMEPYLGATVHYVLPDWGGHSHLRGYHRAAIVVAVDQYSPYHRAELLVLMTLGDNPDNTFERAFSVIHDEGQSEATWHWPERG